MKIVELINKSCKQRDNFVIFAEDHANYLETQQRVEQLNPQVVYHEFAQDRETKEWAESQGYELKLLDFSYEAKKQLTLKVGENSERFHRIRERHMKRVIDRADPSKLTAFVMGYDHALDSKSVIFKDKNLIKVGPDGRVYK